MRGTRIPIAANLVIAALTMAGTAGAMTFGHAVSHLVAPSLATDAGSLIIIGIGMGTAVGSIRALRAPVGAETDRHASSGSHGGNREISCCAAVPIGVALSLNNIGSGVGAGIAGISPVATTLLAGAFSLICVGAGSRVGWSAGRAVAGRQAGLVAGVVLVGVGAAAMLGG